MSPQHFKHFQILELLGRGGMGEVYLAVDSTLERRVALKFLPRELLRDPSAQGRLLDEARSASRVNHPNIAVVHSIEEDGGIYALCMEYVEGLTLKQVLARTRLNLERIVRIAADIASGMQAAHEQGLVHRDLKPANVMISRRDEVKIMDFGLALRPQRVVHTLGPNTYGTVQYMSPEQARGESLTPASDIFSFGSVLYEMITGRAAFSGENDLSTLQSIIHAEPAPLREQRRAIPPALEQLVRGCLSKDIAGRWPSMRAISEELRYLAPSVGAGPKDLISELSTGLRDAPAVPHHQPDNAGAVGRREASGGRRPLIPPTSGATNELGIDLPEGVYVHEVHDRSPRGGVDPRTPRPAPPDEPQNPDGRTGAFYVQTTSEQWRDMVDRAETVDRRRREVEARVVERARAEGEEESPGLGESSRRRAGEGRAVFLGLDQERGTRDITGPFRHGSAPRWMQIAPILLALVIFAALGYGLLRRASVPPPATPDATPDATLEARPPEPSVPTARRASVAPAVDPVPDLLRRPFEPLSTLPSPVMLPDSVSAR